MEKKFVLNLETQEVEEIVPPSRPICCVPGCNKDAHNKVGKGKYDPRTDDGYKRKFGNRGYVCSEHWGMILKVRNNVKSLSELAEQNKLKREEVTGEGILPGYNGNG